MTPLVRIDGLIKSFDGRRVLDDVSLEVRPGDIVSLLGQSGGGKSTLLRCVNLLEQPDAGIIELAGERIHPAGGDLARLRQRVGMVFQRFHLFPHLTAVENVVLAQMMAAGIGEDEAVATAVHLLRRVGLAHRALAFPGQMSGGEQQRVAIARALALKPAVLLFDEPTSALDPTLVGEVLKVMSQLAHEGSTMIVVTHEMAFAREAADRVYFIEEGVFVEAGPPEQVIEAPQDERTSRFLARLLGKF